jgi:hypothetical protein
VKKKLNFVQKKGQVLSGRGDSHRNAKIGWGHFLSRTTEPEELKCRFKFVQIMVSGVRNGPLQGIFKCVSVRKIFQNICKKPSPPKCKFD